MIAATYTNFLSISRELDRGALTPWSTSRSCSPSCSAPTATAATRSCSRGASSDAASRRASSRSGSPTPSRATPTIYLLGGGEDSPQFTALDALRTSGALDDAVGGRRGACSRCARASSSSAPSLAGTDGTPGRRARARRRGHDARAEAARRRGRRARRRARHRLARRLREPPRRDRDRRAARSRSGPRQPARGCATDGVVQRTRRRHLPARPGARAQSRGSPTGCSSGSPARSRRWPTRRPTCSTRSASPRSAGERGWSRLGTTAAST